MIDVAAGLARELGLRLAPGLGAAPGEDTRLPAWVGSGYPRGLTGSAIPPEGRIVAVADVFDALTSDRVYRPAWSAKTTIAWMTNERRKHFDPEVLDAFLSSMDEIRSVQSLMSV